MQLQSIQYGILGFVALATLIWLDLLTAELLGEAILLFLAWAGFSVLLVASAGAWVAFVRSRPAKRVPSNE